jgi:CspA family cold shock protein
MAQYRGTVKWFSNLKGYGFLGHEDGSDVFCHFSAIQANGYKSLREGDEVEFDLLETAEGKIQAVKVTCVKPVQKRKSYS